ncbi:MAG: hypothetical protein M1817_000231 [Caeruleum heppii]|nr:MAG: hypothetical protein M1817_000231 [Caeruleum heppii]
MANMAGMNAAGGPVGGMPMMSNGPTGTPQTGNQHNVSKIILNTHIYDYFLKHELYDCARALLQSDAALEVPKTSPGRRRDADGNALHNGVDENMDTDNKDDLDSKIPDDLPVPNMTSQDPQNSFLHDWWCIFWDIYNAQRKKSKPGEGVTAMQYVQHTQAQQRMRQEQQQHLLRGMNPQMMPQYNLMRMPNGMNLSKTAMQNSRNATPQQLQMAQMKQQQMQRENSQMEMNGDQRAHSPSSADNAPSPSKRPRLENGAFNAQGMGPNGQRQAPGMQGQVMGNNANSASAIQASNMLIQSGINPNHLDPQQFHSFQHQGPAAQQKSIQAYADNFAQHQRSALSGQAMPKGMPNSGGMPGQGSPMMGQMSEGQNMGQELSNLYAGNAPPQRGVGSNVSNHALQDYQVQLMLLERQNKKRLMMARQAEGMNRPDQGGANGQPGYQGMSPQGSRSGPSPGPQDQMKRGTPKMGQAGLPGSPLPDGSMPQARGSPAAMGFNPGQLAPGMTPQLWHEMNQMKEQQAAQGQDGGAMMRPPSSHPGFNGQQFTPQQMEAMARQQAARGMAGQNWQQPQPGQVPMMQQPPPGQQGPGAQMATPQQRTAMPPPQAPAAAGNNSGRTQPSSPQQPAAPPTPQQSTKANPKGKKEGKKPPRKKGSTATVNASATPSSDAEQPPPTPTPATPNTPVHPQSFNLGQNKAAAGQAAAGGNAPGGPTPGPGQPGAPNMGGQPQAPPQQPPPPQAADPNQVAPFPMEGTDMQVGNYALEFDSLDSNDVLSLDFDAFLNSNEDGAGGAFNIDMASMPGYGNPDGVEAGTGDA